MADKQKPEERARIKIDEQLADAGWHIANRGGVTYEHNAIALVEGLLEGNKEADYLLFVDGKVVGVLEAKRSDIDLESAAGGQAANYAHLIPAEYPRWFDEPKIVLLANGEKILLLDAVSGEYNPIATMPTPKKCLDLSGVKSYWGGLPELRESERRALRACQFEAVTNLESSFRRGADRALVVLATGAGKTYTACMASEPNTVRRALVAPLINNIAARDYLLELNAGYVVIQKPGKGEIIYTGFSHAEARIVLDGFEAFLKANPTGNAAIAAVKESREHRFDYPSLASIRDDALHFNSSFSCPKVWNAYALIRQNDVVRLSSVPERDAVTNWLGLARFGLGRTPKLYSLLSSSQYLPKGRSTRASWRRTGRTRSPARGSTSPLVPSSRRWWT